MECKHCKGILPDDAKFCLHCGRACEEEIDEVQEETVVIAADEAPELCEDVSAEEVVASSGDLKKKKGRIIGMCACIVGLVVLAVVLFFGIKGEFDLFSWLKPRENNVSYKDSYSVSDKKADAKGDQVVATMGDVQLTNRQLQVYYWMQVYDFLDYYGAYAAYFGLDTTAPLDEQFMDETQTWQQYFLETAIQNWQTYTALALEAEANGIEMHEEYKEALATMEEEMTKTAQKQGFANVDEMLADEMGSGVTFNEYYQYLVTYYTGYSYFDQYYSSLDPTDAEIDAYFTANEAKFAESKITKESGKYADVRHILKHIKNYGEKASEVAEDDPNYGYTQEAWDKCLAEAQAILDQWLAGEKTEDSFGKLANEKSDDQNGKVTNGGLYEGVEKGQMVEPFENWLFDDVRVVGDYGLVKTEFGYHIMYFVGSEEIWHAEAKNALIAEQSQKLVEDTVTKYPAEVEYKKIALAVVELG